MILFACNRRFFGAVQRRFNLGSGYGQLQREGRSLTQQPEDRRNTRWLLAPNFVLIPGRAGTAAPTEHRHRALLGCESLRHCDISVRRQDQPI